MKAYAVPGKQCLIDFINEETGLTSISHETLDQVRERHPGAELVDVDEWCEAKQREQLRNYRTMWEIEFRDSNGDWFMETAEGTRKDVLQRYRDAGYTPIKIWPKR